MADTSTLSAFALSYADVSSEATWRIGITDDAAGDCINAIRAGRSAQRCLVACVCDSGIVALVDVEGAPRLLARYTNDSPSWSVALNDRLCGVAITANSHNATLLGLRPDAEPDHWRLTPQLTLHGHAHNIPSCDLSADGCRIATCSIDRTVRLWDVPTGRLLHRKTLCDEWSVAQHAALRRSHGRPIDAAARRAGSGASASSTAAPSPRSTARTRLR